MNRQVKDAFAMAMIGDGILSLVRPKRHDWLWAVGPKPLRETLEALAERPGVTMLLAAGEVVAGLLLARNAEE